MGLLSSIGKVAGKALGAFGGPAGLASSALSFLGQERANRQNVTLANTSYRRAMEDMRKAGLNPILAAKLGGADSPAMISGAGPAISSAYQAAQTQSNVGLQGAQTEEVEARIHTIYQQLHNLKATEQLTRQQIWQVATTIEQLQQQTNLAIQQTEESASRTKSVDLDNVQKKILADFYDSAEFAKVAKDIGLSPAAFGGLIRMFFDKPAKGAPRR